ncbi:MAG: AAA family ATPase [Candidatus Omnitrophica bacterium]|nr:AAA family ATPase [Candidatus Omnitrophota bacterium]
MYKEFYNFSEQPFSVTSDPEFFFPSQRHEEAFSHLVYGIQERKGILIITGEIGTGKTTICRTLLGRLHTNIKTALVLNPYFSELQLLQFIVKDLGITGDFRSKLSLISLLNNFLIEQSTLGNNVVLVIDEAQNLKINQLEQIRLLSNLETEKEKLLQIILVGQPELQEKLKLPALRQLTQRVAVRYHILPLDRNDVGRYIEHRVKIAGRLPLDIEIPHDNLPVRFTDRSVEIIFGHSQGTPRVINIICDRALLLGYVTGSKVIDENITLKAVREIGNYHEHHPRSPEKSSVESL